MGVESAGDRLVRLAVVEGEPHRSVRSRFVHGVWGEWMCMGVGGLDVHGAGGRDGEGGG